MSIKDRKNTVLTAPAAIIQIGGVTVGKMKDVSCSEEFTRVPVNVIGRLGPDEYPIVGWRGTMSCGIYLCDLAKVFYAQNKLEQAFLDTYNPLRRDVIDSEVLETTLIIADDIQVDVVIMRKVAVDYDPNTGNPIGAVEGKFSLNANNSDKIGKNAGLQEFARINGIFLTRDNWNINEGAISQRNCEFVYSEPIHFRPNFVVQ